MSKISMNSNNVKIEKILNIAHLAGIRVLQIYNSPKSRQRPIKYKDNKSPLTLADKKSNEILSKELAKLYSDIPILSEEGKDIPYAKRKNWEYFWLIDPLDGTREFVKRNGEFTINIALVYKDRPVLGVIYVPVKDVFYFGQKEIGAYKLEDSSTLKGTKSLKEIIKASDKLPLEFTHRPPTIVASRSHLSKETQDYIEELRAKHGEIEVINIGSSLKMCVVAEGIADIYPRFGPTMEWDTAAGQAIVEAAKGKVLNIDDNQPLKYNKKNLLNPFFIVKK